MGYGYISGYLFGKKQINMLSNILKSIGEGFEKESSNKIIRKVIIVGTNDKEYIKYYKSLAYSIYRYFKKNNYRDIKVYCCIAKGNNYHKKIAIKYTDHDVQACIIGSSNLSKNTLYDNDDYS